MAQIPIDQLSSIVGKGSVVTEPETLEKFSWDKGLVEGRRLDAVVKLKNVGEVAEVVKLANKYSCPMIPCSSGVHSGGNTVPSQGGIVVDLSSMNRILEIDTRNRMTRFEPGVKYGPLQAALAEHDLMALNPLLPHPEKSVLTSHLERDPMLAPKFEYGDPVLTMEVVLPDGQVFRTGSASAPGAPDNTLSDLVGPYGPGLDFFRLFLGAQGTLGIVTWMSVKVEHLPGVQKVFLIPFDRLEDAVEPTYTIQRRMLGNECFLLNRHCLAAIEASQETDVESLARKMSEWTLLLCLAGGRRRPEEKVAYEEKALMEVAADMRMKMVNDAGSYSISVMEEMLRKPWPESKTYWKNRFKAGCYDLGFHTTLERAPELLALVDEVVGGEAEGGIIGHYVQPLERARACYCETHLYYDPSDPASRIKLKRLVENLGKTLIGKGALFTRPDDILSKVAYSVDQTYTSVLRQVKDLLDPNHIMNPGRLCF